MEVTRKYPRSPGDGERTSSSPPVRRPRRTSPVRKSSSPDEPPNDSPPKNRPRKRYSSPDDPPDYMSVKHHRTRRSSNGKSRNHRSSRDSQQPTHASYPPVGREYGSKREYGKRSRSPRGKKSGSPKSRSRSGSSRSTSRSHSPEEEDGARLHVADLGMGITKHDLKNVYEKYGPIQEIWVAKSPPCFAFIVFCLKDDAEDALKSTDGMTLCGSRVRVSFARPRTRGRGSRGFDPNMRCYQCGEKGHFSRDCPDTKYGYKRPPSRSPSRRGNVGVAGGQHDSRSSSSRRPRHNGRRY